jgi:hypothetical protein
MDPPIAQCLAATRVALQTDPAEVIGIPEDQIEGIRA